MPKKKIKSELDWWSDRIENLCGASQEVAMLYDKVKETLPEGKIYEKGPWGFMKLLIVAMYVDIYTNTAKKWFDWIVYIDLCAGPSFNRIERLDEILAGSPLLALIMPRILKSGVDKAFNEMLLFDIDPLNCETLQRVVPGATIVCCDSNSNDTVQLIRSTMEKIPKSHYLAFIDPEGTEIHWKTLEAVFRLEGDLIINYMHSGIARLVGSYHNTIGKTKASICKRLTDFFGTEKWMTVPQGPGSAELLFDLYLGRVEKHRSKVVVIPVPSDVGGFQYRIIIAVKETKTGSPWLNPMEQVRARLEKMNYQQLKLIVDIYRKRQSTLDDFF